MSDSIEEYYVEPEANDFKCRFHHGKDYKNGCPNISKNAAKHNRSKKVVPPWIVGKLVLNGKTYSANAIIRLARMHGDCAILNSKWLIMYEKTAIRLVRTDGLHCVVRNYNSEYSPQEVLNDIQKTINLIALKESNIISYLAAMNNI